MPDENKGGTAVVDLDKLVQSLVARNGNNAEQALRVVADENHTYRRKNAKLREENEKLKTVKPIPEGAVVLESKEDKEAWAEYQKLGKPAEVATKLKTLDETSTELTTLKKASAADDAAEAVGYNRAALRELIKDKGLDLEMKEVEVEDEEEEGKKVKRTLPHVKTGKDGKELVLLTEYVGKNLKVYEPALTASADDDDNEEEDTGEEVPVRRKAPVPTGRRFPKQKKGGETKRKSSDIEKDVKERRATGVYGGI